MAIIARGTKASAGGGTAFVAGTVISPSEVNTDFDTIYAEYNATIGAAGGLNPENLNDYSDTAVERRSEVTPGVTGAESDPTTLAGELERLRYKLKEIGLGTATKRNTTASGDTVYWYDQPQMGPNLIRNGSFSSGDFGGSLSPADLTVAPSGWALVGTPDILGLSSLGTPDFTTAVQIRSDAANEGISQTIVGLKASTKYVVGCRAQANFAGDTFALKTTGANGTTFGNLNLTTTSTTPVTLAGVIVTDSTPTDIVVQLLSVVSTDNVSVASVWVRECASDRIPLPNTRWSYNEITGLSVNFYTPSGAFKDSGLTVNVTPPGPGYTIEIEGGLSFQESGTSTAVILSLQANGSEIATFCHQHHQAISRSTALFSWKYLSPTALQAYVFTVQVLPVSVPIDRNFTAASTETPRTWIRCRAVLESGGH